MYLLSGDQIANDTSIKLGAIVRSVVPSNAEIRTPAGSSSARYASHLPSGDARPARAARFNSFGSPPSVGMVYTFSPASSVAVKMRRVSSAENERNDRARVPLVRQTAEPPIC